MARLKKFGNTGVLGIKWDGTVDCAFDVCDFIRNVEGGIDNNSVAVFQGKGGEYLEAEPGQWIARLAPGDFQAFTGPALLAELHLRAQ